MPPSEPQRLSRKATTTKEWLSRKEAAIYLTANGCPTSARTLEKLASNNNKGKGPSYNRTSWRTVRYHRDDLDAWRKRETQRVE